MKPRYLGDDLVLLLGLDEKKAQDLYVEVIHFPFYHEIDTRAEVWTSIGVGILLGNPATCMGKGEHQQDHGFSWEHGLAR